MDSLRIILFIFIPCMLVSQSGDSLFVTNQLDSLVKVSRALTAKMEYASAMKANDHAAELALQHFGNVSIQFANTRFNKGRIHKFRGELKEALAAYLESKSIREKTLGNMHPDYAWSLNNLAAVYLDLGQFENAEHNYLEAKKIRENVLGKSHPDYSGSLNNLGNLYVKIGNYEKAEQYYLESKEIRKNNPAKEQSHYANSLNNLANLYMRMGKYQQAELLYLESKSIFETHLGKEHPDYASCLNNLAAIYLEMGNYEKAESYYIESKSIRENKTGKTHPDYAASIHNLANLYLAMEQYEKAELFFNESKTIREKTLGINHPDYAASLNNLADLYTETGQPQLSEPLYEQSRSIREKLLGKNHPDYAASMNSLARLHWKNQQYDKAEKEFNECKAIRLQVLGDQHPFYGNTLYTLANFYWDRSDYSKAYNYFTQSSQLDRMQMMKAVNHLSEFEINKMLKRNAENQSMLFSFTHQLTEQKIQSVTSGLSYDDVLFYKGFLLNANIQVQKLAQSNPAASDKLSLLKIYGRRLASEYVKPVAERDEKSIEELKEKSNVLEKEISRTVSGFNEIMKQVRWKDVKEKLKPGEAALEFLHFRYFNKTRETDSILYGVLLIRGADDAGRMPEYIALCEERSLDSLLQVKHDRRSDYVNVLYSMPDRGAIAVAGAIRSLYDLIWKPLESKLTGIHRIYYSGSGLLHRINLGAIPLAEEETINDRYELIGLSSTRQLVIPESQQNIKQDAVLFGAIQYDPDTSNTTGANEMIAKQVTASRGDNWNYLKWTEKEINAIKPLLEAGNINVTSLKGYNATEEFFKSIGANGTSPRIIHLATHGFFFPDPKVVSRRSSVVGQEEPVFKQSMHPMIRSGLILASGNHAWNTGKPYKEGMEDGILTAYEISQMNLSNTELVVLSACETGLGDIQGNEGVYGLQRAFKIAGAKYLIMSLWQIPDQETKEFMVAFYKNWLELKMTIPQAYRKTQTEMRERFINPYQWAGFVLVE